MIIKGRPSDDAVLCTPTSTFLLRTVGISNSLLVCRPPVNAEERRPTLEIRDISHEVLECVPQAANLERIRTVLRDSAWPGLDGDDGRRTGLGKRKRGQGRQWTRAQLESVVQASEGELDRGLKDRNVVEVDGESVTCTQGRSEQLMKQTGKLLLLPIRKLVPLLNLVLTLLTIHSTSTYKPVASPAQPIIIGLAEHDVAPTLGRAVLDLFGDVHPDSDQWTVDIGRLVGEVGKGLLADLEGRSELSNVFMDRWRDTAGETWAEYCDLKLLEVSPSLPQLPERRVIGIDTGLGRAPHYHPRSNCHPDLDFAIHLVLPTTHAAPATGYPLRRPLPHASSLATRRHDPLFARTVPRWRFKRAGQACDQVCAGGQGCQWQRGDVVVSPPHRIAVLSRRLGRRRKDAMHSGGSTTACTFVCM